ncbi:ArgS-related anticodon-binding protein NrtL [Streptomyces sp. H27-H5]|uniref:ArgS-related anticodon-binding protein NrtL n=1 Tax=Streptomyces sp. H27-H5 TaxID=2996460 RepID=UPI00226FD3AC|nr:DALR anticodon-binding domain-containing protein [Streptomyces sp. H27-H5]MCY0957625.1 DALR anticodon-binding domain-containing protein [Streptomyces sp. H27-H5]
MTPADLSRTVVRAVRCAVEDGELPVDAVVPERVVVERTRPGGVGEYATPVAFQVARSARRAPGQVAAVLARRLEVSDGIERVEITGAGFLNFVLRKRSVADLVREIHSQGIRYGCAPDSDQEQDQDQDQDHGQGLAVVPTPRTELRARVVRDVLLRIAATQTAEPAPSAATTPTIAPVPAGEGDVVARFGVDAAAWAMLAVAPHESPVFAGRLLAQDESNEFFRVRYAHSRARALTRNAALLGFESAPGEAPAETLHADTVHADTLLTDTLLRVLGEHPLVLEAAAHHRAPERLVRHLVTVADALLDFQCDVLPQGDEKPSAAHRSRLALAEAAGTVLAGGLTLLGMDAPERL